MQKLMLTLLLAATSLAACSPSANTGAEATLIALSVQLTVEAQASEAPSATPTELAPTPEPTATNTQAPTDIPEPTNTPEPTETPFVVPDWPLFRNGDEAVEVSAIQHLLRSHSHNLTVDGKFGPQTRTQVRSFQLSKSLAADGVVGPNTWAALIQGRQVDEGDSGPAVRAVQLLLRSKFGYSEVNVDGDFGPITENAVKDFQAEYDLAVDGIVGSQTWKALISIKP